CSPCRAVSAVSRAARTVSAAVAGCTGCAAPDGSVRLTGWAGRLTDDKPPAAILLISISSPRMARRGVAPGTTPRVQAYRSFQLNAGGSALPAATGWPAPGSPYRPVAAPDS